MPFTTHKLHVSFHKYTHLKCMKLFYYIWSQDEDEEQVHTQENLEVQVPATADASKKKRKTSKYSAYECAPSNAVYFIFDVETTGSKRNYDKIIGIGFLAYDGQGTLLGTFERKINPGGVSSTYHAEKIHSKRNSRWMHSHKRHAFTHSLTVTLNHKPSHFCTHSLRTYQSRSCGQSPISCCC